MLMKPYKQKQQLATKTRSANEKEPRFNKESKPSTSEQIIYAQITRNGMKMPSLLKHLISYLAG